ncbi:13674_t:CDS:2, partial [Acaulospora colombiana]
NKDNVPGGVKRRRSPSLHAATARPARIPQPPVSNVNKATNPPTRPAPKAIVDVRKNALAVSEPEPPRRLGRMLQALNTRRQSQVILSSSCDSAKSSVRVAFPSERPSSVVLSSRAASPVATSEAALQDEEDEDNTIHPPAKPVVEKKEEPAPSRPSSEPETTETPKPEVRRPEELFEQMTDGDWLYAPPEKRMEYRKEVERVASTFKEEPDLDDPTMVAEYADEIFEYMAKLEEDSMPRPDYMAGQQEITWEMRSTLVDWLLQVHLRYQMLPETLWIAVNIIDRFLSKRIVSVVKLQLVGVTAMFIAAKYEEIIAPGVDEYVKMTEGGYKRDEILKGEKIVLQTIDFRISTYCSPYSWVRRISKADNYNLQTRTLCKFLMELTLLDYRFLRAKPSLIAAIGMYSARRMLGQDWRLVGKEDLSLPDDPTFADMNMNMNRKNFTLTTMSLLRVGGFSFPATTRDSTCTKPLLDQATQKSRQIKTSENKSFILLDCLLWTQSASNKVLADKLTENGIPQHDVAEDGYTMNTFRGSSSWRSTQHFSDTSSTPFLGDSRTENHTEKAFSRM